MSTEECQFTDGFKSAFYIVGAIASVSVGESLFTFVNDSKQESADSQMVPLVQCGATLIILGFVCVGIACAYDRGTAGEDLSTVTDEETGCADAPAL